MRFLLDQCVYASTARFLRDAGHDVVTANDIGRSRATDLELLTIAQDEARILVTRDRDFGGLVHVRGLGAGVIYLHISPATIRSGHRELELILNSYSEDDLRHAFVVVGPGRHRFRKLSRQG